ncbi:MAG: GNAT family N-acetyltransferase [Bacteroidales bacterium]|nr:GNAT family N-acetyltransferase [Bacteroidales bacterium]
MKIRKYGITIIRLKEEHLEIVRKWRNDEEICRYMEFRDYITPEMQKDWFKSVNNIYNSYYVIEYERKLIGLINEKNIDFEKKTAEAGLLIGEKEYLNSPAPLLASLCLLEVGFNIAGGEKCFIKVHKDNKNAIEYNKSMGFVLHSENKTTGFNKYVLDRQNYKQKAEKVIKAVLKLSGNNTEGCVVLEKEDYKKGIGFFTRELMEKSGIKFRKEMEGDDEVYYYSWS